MVYFDKLQINDFITVSLNGVIAVYEPLSVLQRSSLPKLPERLKDRTVRQGVKSGQTQVNPHFSGGRIHRIGNLLLGINGEVPVISTPGDRDVSGCPIDIPALAKPHTANLGQENKIALQFEALRILEGNA